MHIRFVILEISFRISQSIYILDQKIIFSRCPSACPSAEITPPSERNIIDDNILLRWILGQQNCWYWKWVPIWSTFWYSPHVTVLLDYKFFGCFSHWQFDPSLPIFEIMMICVTFFTGILFNFVFRVRNRYHSQWKKIAYIAPTSYVLQTQ